MTARAVVRDLIARHGPVGFDAVMDVALYHLEHGFYATGGQAGRRGDFITSPEVGPLFGAVVAKALDRWWREMGEPAVFTVIEAGAGPGALARSVQHADPACSKALRYVLVEPSAAQRAQHSTGLHLEDAASAFASMPEPDDDGAPTVMPPHGPIVVSMAHLPRLPGPCVVLANELLDNLPFGLAERTTNGWCEVRVGLDGDELSEVLVPTAPDDAGSLDRLVPDAPVGARVPLQRAAARWVDEARALATPTGRVVVFDYASTTADLATRPEKEWLRTYRSHSHGTHPLLDLGEQDITCEVALDQLSTPGSDMAQADWLRQHGLDALVAEGRAVWEERAAIGDLAAVRARSRITEAEALTDPSGLGAFRVLEWPGR